MKNLLLIIFLILPVSLFAYQQDNGEKKTFWKEIESQKVAFFTHELGITTKEAVSFWPLYNEMEAKLREVEKQKRQLRRDACESGCSSMTEDEYEALIIKMLLLDSKKNEIRKSYFEKLMKVIPPSKLIRLDDVEEHFRQRLFDRLRQCSKPKIPQNG